MNAHIAPVRRPLLAVCDLNDNGHDVHFLASGKAWAEHISSGAITPFVRRGGRFDLEAEVMLPDNDGAPVFQGQVANL